MNVFFLQSAWRVARFVWSSPDVSIAKLRCVLESCRDLHRAGAWVVRASVSLWDGT